MKKKSRLVFTGDIGFDSYMDGRFKDPGILTAEVLEFLRGGDHVVANVEGALIDQKEAVDFHDKKAFFHTMDPGAVQFLNMIRADIWNFANNHSMDSGEKGVASGLHLAAENGCRTIGAGRNIEEASIPAIIDEAGGIGLIGLGYIPGCVGATKESAGSFPWNDKERKGDPLGQGKVQMVRHRLPRRRGIRDPSGSLYAPDLPGLSGDGRGYRGGPSSSRADELRAAARQGHFLFAREFHL